MATFRLRMWTGPTAAKEIGRSVRRVGFKVTTGTEHIIVDVKGAGCGDAEDNQKARLRRRYRKDYGLRAMSCSVRGRK